MKCWKGAQLLRTSLTEPAEMLASKDMVAVENVRDEALPAVTTTDLNQSQTERHCQIGVDAALKLLGSLVSGTMPDGVAAYAVVDLSPRTGDFGLAVLSLLSQAATPLHYFSCAEDEEHREWLNWWLKHTTTESILAGRLQPLGFHLPPEEPPADECAGFPPKPALSVLVWESRQGVSSEVHIPADVVAKWSGSPDWADPMKVLADRVAAAGRDPVCSPPPPTRVRISGPDPTATTEPGVKAEGDTAPVPEVLVTEVPTLAHDVKFQAGRFHDLWLCVAAPAASGGGIFIANRGDADVELPSGSLVAGFYTGKWFHCSGDAVTDPDKDVPFILSGADDLVLIGGILATVSDALDKHHSRKVQYHTLEPDPLPGAPGHFKLTLKHEVYYRCLALPAAVKTEPDSPALTLVQGHAGSALPPSRWDTELTRIVWTVKFHPAKGLSPVRPQVVLKCDLKVNSLKVVQF